MQYEALSLVTAVRESVTGGVTPDIVDTVNREGGLLAWWETIGLLQTGRALLVADLPFGNWYWLSHLDNHANLGVLTNLGRGGINDLITTVFVEQPLAKPMGLLKIYFMCLPYELYGLILNLVNPECFQLIVADTFLGAIIYCCTFFYNFNFKLFLWIYDAPLTQRLNIFS